LEKKIKDINNLCLESGLSCYVKADCLHLNTVQISKCVIGETLRKERDHVIRDLKEIKKKLETYITSLTLSDQNKEEYNG
jgi:hypothetical protein